MILGAIFFYRAKDLCLLTVFHSFSNVLWAMPYVPGIVFGFGHMMMSETDKNHSCSFCFLTF